MKLALEQQQNRTVREPGFDSMGNGKPIQREPVLELFQGKVLGPHLQEEVKSSTVGSKEGSNTVDSMGSGMGRKQAQMLELEILPVLVQMGRNRLEQVQEFQALMREPGMDKVLEQVQEFQVLMLEPDMHKVLEQVRECQVLMLEPDRHARLEPVPLAERVWREQ